ncbi:hypothetical protein N0V83_008271 [Neocucurbitaria cava]|uniref:Uncharacterized protein n=1 Tax=Neocucurbitaria cava TaxID=798079 RepID=A0A9W8Y1S8_9PLEO|nr:hypothetical protein N0V83_008271 [Neocucurbitaria cava]
MPTGSDTSDIDSTVRITSYLTWTSFITVQPPTSHSSHSSVDTNTLAVPTSIPSGVSALPSSYPTLNPSGSGYAWPSGTGNGTIVSPTGTGNGTIVSPKPTYSDIPMNMGQVVGAGKSSLAAFVVALAFAHLA